ncbi:hypothetical protein FA15DRAFT_758780 [Coprinopsis marcescibilis]|uniref:MYND-type domain-containing protein n=1 Tax=Coprinopsis marcescibilis TaxID=230819 RepID=A0A5C3KM25_COPMA|nr:hypothetical protein FA15DRAFT_758780 [Coprinopsis marcescibilis]
MGTHEMDSAEIRQLLETASSLHRLARRWTDRPNAESMEAFLVHLDPALLPNLDELQRQYPPALIRVELVVHCLEVVTTAVNFSNRSQNLAKIIQTSISRHLQSITTSVAFITDHVTVIWPLPCAEAHKAMVTTLMVLCGLNKLDSTIWSTAIAQKSTLRSILNILTVRFGGSSWKTSKEYIYFPTAPENCPALAVFASAMLRDEPTVSKHYSSLVDAHGDAYVAEICECLVARLEVLAKKVEGNVGFVDDSKRFVGLFSLIRATHDLSKAPFVKSLLKPHVLRRTTAAIWKIMKKLLIRRGDTSPFAVASGWLIFMVLDLTRMPDYLNAMVSMVDGGILLTLLGDNQESKRLRTGIAIHSMFPTVVRFLAKWFNDDYRTKGLDGEKVKTLQVLRDHITFLRPSASRRVLKSQNGHCSNLKCPNKGIVRVRYCAKCHMCSYCSEECQRGDWSDRHREECAPAAQHYLELKREDRWVTRSMRRFYYSVMERLFNRDWAPLPFDLKDSVYVQEPSVLLYDSTPTNSPLEGRRCQVKNYAFKTPRFNMSPYFERRIEHMLAEICPPKASHAVRIAEGRFYFGRDTDLMVMVKLELDFRGPGEDNLYHVTSGLIRIGSSYLQM